MEKKVEIGFNSICFIATDSQGNWGRGATINEAVSNMPYGSGMRSKELTVRMVEDPTYHIDESGSAWYSGSARGVRTVFVKRAGGQKVTDDALADRKEYDTKSIIQGTSFVITDEDED